MRLSIIVPAYNEGEKIYDNLKIVVTALSAFSSDFEVIAVNDGSKDNTASEILRASESDRRIVPCIYEVNRGKGGAIVEGVSRASGEIIGFLDADLDLPPEMLRGFYEKMMETGCDIVIGSKMHPDSKVDYPFARKLFSFCYYVMLKILFGLKCKDTQTGIKLYRAEILKKVAKVQKVKGFAFDIEQLALSTRLGAKLCEMPITLNFTRAQSFGRIKFKDVFKMFTDTIKIWWELRIIKKYKLE